MKAALLAAGKGARLDPITETRPKQLISLSGKPLIAHILNTLKETGLNDLLIVIGEKKRKLFEKTLADHVNQKLRIQYIEQKMPKGTAHAASLLKRHTKEEPILLIYGDVIPKLSLLKKLLNIYEESEISLMVVAQAPKVSEFGVVEFKDNRLIRIVEKPHETSGKYVNAGIYIFTKKIFPFIDNITPSPRGELELTDSLNNFVSSGGTVRIVKAKEDEWMHISTPWDLLEVNEKLLKQIVGHNEGHMEEPVKIKGEVVIGRGAVLKSGSVIEGPVHIGEESLIGPNCFIRPYTTIGRRVKVGNACEIKNSIIMDDSRISHLSYIGDSLIAEGCNIGAGTITANLRLDEKSIRMKIKEAPVDSGRKKLGVVLGDRVKTGIQVCLMPGVKVGCDSIIGPNTTISEDIPPNKLVKTEDRVKIVDLID